MHWTVGGDVGAVGVRFLGVPLQGIEFVRRFPTGETSGVLFADGFGRMECVGSSVGDGEWRGWKRGPFDAFGGIGVWGFVLRGVFEGVCETMELSNEKIVFSMEEIARDVMIMIIEQWIDVAMICKSSTWNLSRHFFYRKTVL